METTNDKLICLNCGYDLRGTPGDKCSECGTAFDREDIRHSFIPWERDVYGVWRFPMTLIAMLFWTKRMRADCLCRHDLHRSRRFLFYMSLVCVIPLLLVFFWVFYYYNTGNLSDLMLHESQVILETFDPLSLQSMRNPQYFKTAHPLVRVDQMFLQLMGMTLKGSWGFFWGVLCVAIWNWDWMKAPGDVFKSLKWKTAEMREVRAIGNYMAGPAGTALMLFWAFVAFQSYLAANNQLCIFLTSGDKTPQSLILNCISVVFGGLCIGRLVFLIHRMTVYKTQLEPTNKSGWISIILKLCLTLVWRGVLWAIVLPFFIGLTRLAVECVQWAR